MIDPIIVIMLSQGEDLFGIEFIFMHGLYGEVGIKFLV